VCFFFKKRWKENELAMDRKTKKKKRWIQEEGTEQGCPEKDGFQLLHTNSILLSLIGSPSWISVNFLQKSEVM